MCTKMPKLRTDGHNKSSHKIQNANSRDHRTTRRPLPPQPTLQSNASFSTTEQAPTQSKTMSTEEDPTLAVLQDVAFDIVGTGDDVSSSHLEQHTSLSMDIPQDAVNVVASVVDAVDLPTVILNGDSIIEQKTEADGITSDSGPPPRLSTTVFSQAWMKNFEKLKQYKEKVRFSHARDLTLTHLLIFS